MRSPLDRQAIFEFFLSFLLLGLNVANRFSRCDALTSEERDHCVHIVQQLIGATLQIRRLETRSGHVDSASIRCQHSFLRVLVDVPSQQPRLDSARTFLRLHGIWLLR